MFNLYCNVPHTVWQISMRYPNMKPSDVFKMIQKQHKAKENLREAIKYLLKESLKEENF